MAENPIRYSDLIVPDESIEKLIAQLEQLEQIYTSLLQKVQAEAKNAQKAQQGMTGATEQGRKSIREAATDAEKLARAERDLAFAQSETAKEIAKLKEQTREQNNLNKAAAKEAMNAKGSYNALSAEYTRLKIELNKLTAEERKNTEAGRQMEKQAEAVYQEMKRLQEATGKFQLNVGNYSSAFGNLGGMLGSFKSGLGGVTSVVSKATLGITSWAAAGIAAVGVVKDDIATAREYEKAVSGLAAILGTTKDQITALTDQAQNLGATTIFTASEAAALQTELAKLGYSVNDIINMAPSVLSFAQATGSGLAEAASLAGAALRMFEKDTTHTEEFVDKMTAATSKSALSFSYLNSALSTVAPVANAFGFEIEDVLALLGQLANAGFDASSAATATRNIILNLADANGNLAKALGEPVTNLDTLISGLNKLKDSGIDLGEALELTDKRSVAAFNTFLSGTDNVINLRNELNNCDGAAKKMADTMADNLDGSLESMSSAWEGLNLHINESSGGLKRLIDWITTAIRWIDTLATSAGRAAAALKAMNGGGDGTRSKIDKQIDYLGGSGHKEVVYKNAIATYNKQIQKLQSEIESGSFKTKLVKPLLEARRDALIKMRDEYERRGADILNPAASSGGGNGGGGGNTGKTGSSGSKTAKGSSKTLSSAAKEAEKIRQQQEKNEREALRKQQDTEVALIEDKFEREREVTILSYDRQKEDLQRKLDEDKNLTEKARTAINQTIENLEKQKVAKIVEINDKELKEQQKDEEKRLKDAEKAQKDKLHLEEQEIRTQKQIDELQIDSLETSENEKTRMRLEAEKKRLKMLMEAYKRNGKVLTAVEQQVIDEQIKNIDKQLERNKNNRDIYDLMGLNLTDEKKEAISTSVQYAVDAVNEFMDAYVAAAERKAELAEKEVERAQDVLLAEINARAAGYANNVLMAQKELDLAKKNQQKALREQEKAQKQQMAIQTIQQIGNMVTASSLIWSQLGFPWAIPALAIMWGSFALSKIKAAQMVGSGSEEYGEGTVELLEGGSHQSGNDIDLGRKKDGTRRRAEGGEFFAVINKRSSRKYRAEIPQVIHALNDGTFAEKYMGAYRADGLNVVVDGGRTDISGLSDDVRQIRQQGESRMYQAGAYTVYEYKNVKRKVRTS